jgi:hypothetical protein
MRKVALLAIMYMVALGLVRATTGKWMPLATGLGMLTGYALASSP